jgi:glycosyltransferase involved in cell wall biosynthesis
MPDPLERAPIAEAPLSVLLPAYNQEADLEKSLGDWVAYLESLGRDYEILVVDDGSTDRTGELSEGFSVNHPRMRVLRHTSRQGIGAALRTGLAAVQHPLCFYADCNNGYVPSDLKLLLEAIDQVDLVAPYRVWPGRRPRTPLKEHFFRWLVRLIFGVKLKDIDCSFKLFRREILARIPIQSNSSFVHTEILAKANFLGCLMTELPISYQPLPGSGGEASSLRQRRAEAFRIFRNPDFGPTVLPTPVLPSTETVLEE